MTELSRNQTKNLKKKEMTTKRALAARRAKRTRLTLLVLAILAVIGLSVFLICRALAPYKPTESGTYAAIAIRNYGTITVKLDPEAAPITTENFVKLAESGFYEGTTFHRIKEGFMMQGGAPKDGTSAATIKGEFSDNGVDNPLKHTRGTISMARANAYDSASSQFFIMQQDTASLDGKYAAFGHVVDGIEVVDKVCTKSSPTDNNGTIPAAQQPIIQSVTIIRVE